MRHTTTRKLRHLLTQAVAIRRTRCALARAVVDPAGLFGPRVKPSARLYRRRPKHPERAMAEHFA